MNKKILFFLLSSIIFIFLFTSYNRISSNSKYVNIYDVIKEAFLTDKGYTNELSKHISNEVFKKINIYYSYPLNMSEYKKPFKINFSLKEISQTKDKDIVYVKMIYSVDIEDSNNKTVGGSHNASIIFSVKKTTNGWYIINKEESA